MKATTAPAAPGAMLYHSMLTQVLTCATSFHQLYSMMKLAAVGIAQPINANETNTRMTTRICEGRIEAIFEFAKPGNGLVPAAMAAHWSGLHFCFTSYFDCASARDFRKTSTLILSTSDTPVSTSAGTGEKEFQAKSSFRLIG